MLLRHAFLVGVTMAVPAIAQLTYPSCAPLQATDFQMTELFNRKGDVKMYDGAAEKVSLMGKIDVWGNADNGLMALALHPDFESNRWICFWYSPKQLIGQNRQLRLTRSTGTPRKCCRKFT